ncbi:lactoferrin/transferrin-binding protein LbpA [Neisseria meningitidis]|uniref:lactoferrin/transferrin-binding protein LbpA n=1 Tax=Neisseria meningitidis TaxID=487 RepID=UPI001C5AE93C|nr:lactoferrin/transferrin-binding protein LbpA [Neisseria meningitidis]MBW3920572.1 lactoferrin/transferrin family TonB-dependent receptor [Neisseria meningitidis]
MNKKHGFQLTLTALAVATAFPAYAAQVGGATPDAAQTQSLKEVTVRAAKVGRRSKEATGLGKIVKTSETLNKEQVLGIRDLTRYDPGVAVVEQGNGASGGYSIRGVDKNRVAVSVDGVAQIQAFTVQGSLSGYGGRGGSGAINEIEYENISTVEIDKGAGSSDHGSGALGGAVAFRTKEAADLISDGKSWGIQAKTAYGSKNRQFMKSLGAGFSKDGWEGLLIRTERQGRETRPHGDIADGVAYGINRLDAFRQTHDIQRKDKTGQFFSVEGESESKPVAKLAGYGKYLNNQLNRWVEERKKNNQPLSAEEEAMVREAQARHENLSAQAYTGGGRILPDPMDYRSGSWLAKLGYRFGGRHYVGGVFEDTKQRYDIRDMTEKQYYGTDESKKFSDKSGVYDGNDFRDGLYFRPNIEEWKGDTNLVKGIGLKYSRTKFIDEHHRRRRMGLLYRYENEAYSDNWADKAVLSFDKQGVATDNNTLKLNCAVYPAVDKSCRASADKPYSYDSSDRFHYREQHNVLNASFEKSLKNKWTKHHLTLGFGYDASNAISRPEQLSHNAARISESTGFDEKNQDKYLLGKPEVVEGSVCGYIETLRSRKCVPRKINGSNIHISLNDRFSIGKYFDFSLGGRYDRKNFTTSEELVRSGRYVDRSWNSGIVFKPNRHFSVSYRASSGFRTPSFQELFGIDIYHDYPKGWQRPALKSEKAANREIGLQWKGDFGFLEISSFRNRYTDMIAVADHKTKLPDSAGRLTEIDIRDYYNAQNMSLQGVNILGKIDWNGVYGKLPEGLYTTLAYNRIKPKSVSNRPDLSLRSYALDAVQPSRYVLGFGYDQPEGKWGANIMLTYSKGKNPDELAYLAGDQKRYSTKRASSSWSTADVSAYLNLKKRLTLRAAIYNIGNYRYVTWESLRQTAESTANRHGGDSNYGRYAAPGRNFSLALEMKF